MDDNEFDPIDSGDEALGEDSSEELNVADADARAASEEADELVDEDGMIGPRSESPEEHADFDDEDSDEGDADDDEDEGASEKESYWVRRLRRNADRIGDKLKANIPVPVEVCFTDDNKYLRFDWSGDNLLVEEAEGKGSKADDKICQIKLAYEDFRRISRGRLNPQIAMLSNKVVVAGRVPTAVYFFNLVNDGRRR